MSIAAYPTILFRRALDESTFFANSCRVSNVSTPGRSEAALLARARNGDIEAFAELFEPLRAKAVAVAARIVGPDRAEDVAMDAFLQAWKALPAFGGRSSLSTWLLRIARNRALDVLRAENVRRAEPLDAPDEDGRARPLPDLTADTPAQIVERRDLTSCVERALETLPPMHRQCLLHRYADDLSYAEIAAATGVSIGTVMSRLFNARRKLKAALRAAGIEDVSEDVAE